MLTDVARAVESTVGERDVVGRMGDNTFVILCRGGDIEYGQRLGERVRVAMEEHLSEVDGQSVTLTASVGVARITDAISNPQDLLSLASSAALEAAQAGGNRVETHSPVRAARQDGDDSLIWIERVRDALEKDLFMLVFQPVVSLHGTDEHNYEVLLRLKGNDGEIIKAGVFMPHIANHEIMLKIDQWVLRHALQRIEDSRSDQNEVQPTFFIKLAMQTIGRPEMLPWLAKLLRKHRLSGECVVLEAPESKLMTNLKPARQFLKGLRQLHCRFAIEQFGSGLNSFQILKHLPAEFLKIDRSFMKDLPTNAEHQAKIREITDQAHAQGKTTIAEFVEDAQSMSILWQCGVNYVQGNFLQEPEKVLSYDFS